MVSILIPIIFILIGLSINIYFKFTKEKIGRGAKTANNLITISIIILTISIILKGAEEQKKRLNNEKILKDSLIYQEGYNKALKEINKDSI
jgi:hypothetical protein